MAKPRKVTKLTKSLLRGEDLPVKVESFVLKRSLNLLVKFTQQAHRRTKRAEEKLAELPNWESRCKEAQSSLQTAEKRLADYHDELDRWKKQADEQYDAVNKQLNEKDAVIAQLKAQLETALHAFNCRTQLLAVACSGYEALLADDAAVRALLAVQGQSSSADQEAKTS